MHLQPIIVACERDLDLLNGCLDTFEHHGGNLDDVLVFFTDKNHEDWNRTCSFYDEIEQVHPHVANEAWKHCLMYGAEKDCNVLFLEADCVFTKPDVVESLRDETDKRRALVLGEFCVNPYAIRQVTVDDVSYDLCPMRTNGVSVWSPVIRKLFNWTSCPSDMPFDIWLAPEYCAFMQRTEQIMQIPASRKEDLDSFKLTNKNVGIVHGCKDLTLRDRIIAGEKFETIF